MMRKIGFTTYYIIGAIVIWWFSGDIMFANAHYSGEIAAFLVFFVWGKLAIIVLPVMIATLHQLMLRFDEAYGLKNKLTILASICIVLLSSFAPYMIQDWDKTWTMPALIGVMMFFWSLFATLISKG